MRTRPRLQLDELRWTTRTEVCDRLADYLIRVSPPPGEQDYDSNDPAYQQSQIARERAIWVLAHLADAAHAPALTPVAIHPHRYGLAVRTAAVEALLRLQVVLPLRHLGPLPDTAWVFDHAWEVGQYLLLFRQGKLPDRIRQFFERPVATQPEWAELSAHEGAASMRGTYLVQFLELGPLSPLTWIDWLYQRWVAEDREVLEQAGEQAEGFGRRTVPLNVRIASLSSERSASQALLAEYRLRPSTEAHRYLRTGGTPLWPHYWETVPPELWQSVAEVLRAVEAKPEAFAQRAQDLDLPYEALLRYTEAPALLQRIEAELRSTNPTWEEEVTPRLWRCLQLLQRWPDDAGDHSLTSQYNYPETSGYLRSHLWSILWERSWARAPETQRAAVRSWPERKVGLSYMGQALLRLAERPEPADTAFFYWAADRPEKPEFRYQAILAMELLGDDSPRWMERLGTLLEDSDALVRVTACGALLRLGDRSTIDGLVEAAENEVDPFARTEALRRLGEEDTERFLPQFRTALLRRASSPWDVDLPLDGIYADEAAFQLASLGTPEALTALLHGCLLAEDAHSASTWLDYLASAAHRQEGRHELLIPLHREWRLCRPWEWRCCGVP